VIDRSFEPSTQFVGLELAAEDRCFHPPAEDCTNVGYDFFYLPYTFPQNV
jgi:hypothetical protein